MWVWIQVLDSPFGFIFSPPWNFSPFLPFPSQSLPIPLVSISPFMDAAAVSRSSLRTLLRAVDRYVSRAHGNDAFRTFLLDSFRRGGKPGEKEAPPAAGDGSARTAVEYATLLDAVHEHKNLLISYNISTDKYATRKQQLGNVAGSVGLQMPKEYQEK